MSTVDVPWPEGPDPVLARGIATPSRAYRRHAWAALMGLLTFLTVYAGLTAWFGYAAYRRLHMLYVGEGMMAWNAAVAFPALLLFLVMIRGLFYVRRAQPDGLVRVTPAEEPVLFAFIERLAKEARAPRPKRVYLAPNVNAAVFYRLSWWNLIIPARKHLLVGLGLVNALSLDEFKAVVAHELGHFAQRTMRIGSWVYLAKQFVGDLVMRRDALDRALQQLARLDVPFRWLGTLLQVLVWSLRSILELAFRAVVALERALSREMEFQADLVAVSLTGSDSLVHGLHRAHAADLAFDRALHFAMGRCAKGEPPADLYAIQDAIVRGVAHVRQEPGFGQTPPLPEQGRADHRVFRPDIAEAPKMWATHPPNHEREENAKARYLPSHLDPRSAWVLFRDPAQLRVWITRNTLERLSDEALPGPCPHQETEAAVAKVFASPHLDPRYRGAWVDRSATRHVPTAAGLVRTGPAERDAVVAALDALYPASLRHDIERVTELGRERVLLLALRDGFLEAPGGVLRFRGREIRRRDLSGIVASLTEDLEQARALLHTHDEEVRTAHVAAAKQLGQGWPAYLESLHALLHYAEHASADLEDALEHVDNYVTMALADSNVTRRERRRIVKACEELHAANQAFHTNKRSVGLPAPLAEALGLTRWLDAFEPDYTLPPTHLRERGAVAARGEGVVHAGRARGARARGPHTRCAGGGRGPGRGGAPIRRAHPRSPRAGGCARRLPRADRGPGAAADRAPHVVGPLHPGRGLRRERGPAHGGDGRAAAGPDPLHPGRRSARGGAVAPGRGDPGVDPTPMSHLARQPATRSATPRGRTRGTSFATSRATPWSSPCAACCPPWPSSLPSPGAASSTPTGIRPRASTTHRCIGSTTAES